MTPVLSTPALLSIAIGAVAVLLFLIIRLRVHAFVALTLVSLATALVAGLPADQVIDVLYEGFGSTLAAVALLVGFGAMLGRLVEHSGGARVLADRMVAVFGEKRAPVALGLASLAMGFPMFLDAGLIVMLPIIFAVARRLDGPVLAYGLPAAAAFSVMHVFVPPHPGPVTATALYGANPGLVLITGLVLAIPVWWVSGVLWSRIAARRHPFGVAADLFATGDDTPVTQPPGFATVLGVLAIPLVLIGMSAALDFAIQAGTVNADDALVAGLQLLGATPVALLISLLVAVYVLGLRRGTPAGELESLMDSALPAICSVVLITGAGGMFGGVLQATGIGDALSQAMSGLGLPVIVAVYLVAVVLRLAQGSATVALVTASSLMAPTVIAGDYSAMQVTAIVLASAAGSVFASHVNDSGFWLVGRLMGMDVATTLKTWTVQQSLQSVIAFALTVLIYVIF